MPGDFGFDVGGRSGGVDVVGDGGWVDGSVPLVGIEQFRGGRGEHEFLLLFGALVDVARLAAARRTIRRYGKEVFIF